MRDQIEHDGIVFVPARKAAAATGLTRDYIARLCKRGLVVGRRTESGWYVDEASLRGFQEAQGYVREFRREHLAKQRSEEYRASFRPSISRAPSELTSAPRESDLQQKMRRAFEEPESVGANVLSSTSALPSGITHAALQSAPALAHVPVFAIAPMADMLHKAAALAMTFLLVAGIFVLVAPQQSRTIYANLSSSVTSFDGRAVLHEAKTRFSIELANMRAPLPGLAPASSARVSVAVVPRGTPIARSPSLSARAAAQAAAAASSLGTQGSTAAQSASVSGAQAPQNTIATNIEFTGPAVAYGDIISFDAKTGVYSLATTDGPDVYGVVVEHPALLYNAGNSRGVPVLRSGAALVNVTLEGGAIGTGDPLAISSIPGKARRASANDKIIGTAGEAFDGASGVPLQSPDGKTFRGGTIRTDLSFAAASSPDTGTGSCTSVACLLFKGVDPSIVRAVARYLLAGIIAVLALYLAFHSFMAEANYGVISIGRNPLARSSIQSMVFLNGIIAFVIASAGLFAAVVVLFVLS